MSDFSQIDADFGDRFAKARSKRGMSQEYVVEEMAKRGYQMHVTAIGKIQRGDRRVTIGEAAALASILEVPLETLTGGADLDVWTTIAATRNSEIMARERMDAFAQAMASFAEATDAYVNGLPDGTEAKSWDWQRQLNVNSPARIAYDSTRRFLQIARNRPKGPIMNGFIRQYTQELEALRPAIPTGLQVESDG